MTYPKWTPDTLSPAQRALVNMATKHDLKGPKLAKRTVVRASTDQVNEGYHYDRCDWRGSFGRE